MFNKAYKKLDFDEVLSYLEKLLYNEYKNLVYHYSTHTKANFENELDEMITLDFQQRFNKVHSPLKSSNRKNTDSNKQ